MIKLTPRLMIRTRAGRWLPIIRLLPHAGRGLVAATVLLNVAVGVLPLVFVWWISVLISRLPYGTDVGAAFAVSVGAFVLQQLLAPFQGATGEIVTRRVNGYCVDRLTGAALSAPQRVLERPDAMNLLSDARGGFESMLPTPGDAAAGLLALIYRYVQLLGAVVLIWIVLGPLAAATAAVTALIIRYGQRGSLSRFGAMWIGLAPARRKLLYIRRLATGADAAKEIRVLGLIGWFLKRHDRESRAYLSQLWAGRRRILFWPFIGFSLVGLAGGGLLLSLLARTSSQMSLLELVVAIQAVVIPLRFGTHFPESDTPTMLGLQADTSLRKFEALAVCEPSLGFARTGEIHAPRKAIRFEDVSFRYAPGEPLVLDGLDLEIEAGRSLAIVGLNGAGKTTLVKLLTRLYDPDAGRIAVDGADLREMDPRAWHRHIAVIFQDFVRYELSAADNITLGAAHVTPDPAALAAAIDRAGAREIIDALPGGEATILSRRYHDGRDLSGGQWQRIALARALYAVAAGAKVLVMDEPTAHLDVRAEVAFYDNFLALTEGLTTVVISHRFSSVRRADRIVVLEHGRAVEQGTHDSLLAAGGRYADLFHLQAKRFADPLTEVTPQ